MCRRLLGYPVDVDNQSSLGTRIGYGQVWKIWKTKPMTIIAFQKLGSRGKKIFETWEDTCLRTELRLLSNLEMSFKVKLNTCCCCFLWNSWYLGIFVASMASNEHFVPSLYISVIEASYTIYMACMSDEFTSYIMDTRVISLNEYSQLPFLWYALDPRVSARLSSAEIDNILAIV